jgi:hypothetical protein
MVATGLFGMEITAGRILEESYTNSKNELKLSIKLLMENLAQLFFNTNIFICWVDQHRIRVQIDFFPGML